MNKFIVVISIVSLTAFAADTAYAAVKGNQSLKRTNPAIALELESFTGETSLAADKKSPRDWPDYIDPRTDPYAIHPVTTPEPGEPCHVVPYDGPDFTPNYNDYEYYKCPNGKRGIKKKTAPAPCNEKMS